jgi:alpha-beta hydrolase superfamily lysophospholipase
VTSTAEITLSLPSIDGIPLDARQLRVDAGSGSVLLAHGFAVDLHEMGAFDSLTVALAEAGLNVFRFTFRGHPGSGGTQEGVTISGERLDVQAAYRWMSENLPGPYFVVGASFGAVSTTLQLASFQPVPVGLVLWNPALELPKILGADTLETARQQGYVEFREDLRVGVVLLEERALFPRNLGLDYLGAIPTAIFHGTEDSLVPIAWARTATEAPNVELIEIVGSEHGFHEPVYEREVVAKTVEWIRRVLRGA